MRFHYKAVSCQISFSKFLRLYYRLEFIIIIVVRTKRRKEKWLISRCLPDFSWYLEQDGHFSSEFETFLF